MSIQTKLQRKSYLPSRKLFDNHIKVCGDEVRAALVHFEIDKYDDDTGDYQILKNKIIDCVIDYPTDIPILRYRYGSAQQTVDINESGASSGFFFFDILPIEVFTKWEDHVEKGDIIFHRIQDENNTEFVIALQMTELLGKATSVLSWKKFFAAPYSGELPASIRTELGI
jgi:hypothetical protein